MSAFNVPSIAVCAPSAALTASSLAAPDVGQGARNRAAWMAIADFLSRQNLRAVLAARAASCAALAAPVSGKRSAATGAANACAAAAGLLALPDGNHGETF